MEEIGVLISLALHRKTVADLEAVRSSGGSGLTVQFIRVGSSRPSNKPT